MPLWLRKFTFKKIDEFYEKQNTNSSNNTVEESIANMKAAGAVSKQTVPDYVVKASKK